MSSQDSSTNYPDDHGRFDGLLPAPSPSRIPELPPDETLPEIDQIAIRKLGGFNFLEPSQWTALSRDDRMRLIKSGVVTFLSQGTEVPLREALQSLQAAEGRAPSQAPERRPGEAYPPPGPGRVNFDPGSPRPGEV